MNLQDKEQSAKLSSAIWRMADDLWGDFKHTDFARIILPFLLLRRIECVLEPTREAVRKFYLAEKQSGIDLGLVLPEVAGFAFYNTSEYSLETLGASDTGDNLEHYISQFSKNVRTIFDEFKFGQTIEDLEKAKLLYRMVSYFANLDLHPDVVSDRVLSDAYEELIFKFASSVNEKAGEFMTPRDAVRLATKLVLAADEDIFSEKGVIRTIYDPTCGTGGFLSDAISQIEEMGSSAKVVPFGQELDPATHAMALTNMMIRGFDANNIKQGYTLSDDQLRADKFHYGLAMATLDAMSADDKANMLDYIDDYCGEQKLKFDKENQKFEISTDDELKLLLYGIEQRFYTTPFGKEKRLANSVTAMDKK